MWKQWEHSVIFPLNKAWWKQSPQRLPNWAESSSLSSTGRGDQGPGSSFCLKASLFSKARGAVSPAVPPTHTPPGPFRGHPQMVGLNVLWTTGSLLYFTAQTLWFSNFPAGECTIYLLLLKIHKVCFLLIKCPEKPISVTVAPLGLCEGGSEASCIVCTPGALLQMGDWGLWSQMNCPQFWIQPQPGNSPPSIPHSNTHLCCPPHCLEVTQVLLRQEVDGPQAEWLESVPYGQILQNKDNGRGREELSPAWIKDKETMYFSFLRSRRPP